MVKCEKEEGGGKMMVERIQKGQRRRGRESVIEPAGHDANNNKRNSRQKRRRAVDPQPFWERV